MVSKKLCVWRRTRAKFASATLEFLAKFSRFWRAARSTCIFVCRSCVARDVGRFYSNVQLHYYFLPIFSSDFDTKNMFSLFENVSFLVNRKWRGISERAHMRRRSAGPPWCGVVAIIVSFLILKMFIFGEPQYRGYFRESSYEGAVWRTPFVQSSSNNRFVPSLKIFIFGLISTRT